MYRIKIFLSSDPLTEHRSYESKILPVKNDIILYEDGKMYEVERRLISVISTDLVLLYVNPLK